MLESQRNSFNVKVKCTEVLDEGNVPESITDGWINSRFHGGKKGDNTGYRLPPVWREGTSRLPLKLLRWLAIPINIW
jgi:hypothetical protein